MEERGFLIINKEYASYIFENNALYCQVLNITLQDELEIDIECFKVLNAFFFILHLGNLNFSEYIEFRERNNPYIYIF